MRVPPDARERSHRLSPARSYLRTLRSPNQNTWYGDMDPRSWRVALQQRRSLELTRSDLRRARTIIGAGRADGRTLCTLPRSGTNWIVAMVTCGLSLSQGGTGAFTLEPDRTAVGDDEWVFDGPRFGWPVSPQSLATALSHDRVHPLGEPLFTYGHEPLSPGLIDHRGSRPVVTLRDPYETALSLVQKDGLAWYRQAPSRLPVSVDRVDRFFSIWERRLADPDTAERTLVLRYEDLCDDPAVGLRSLGRHWRLDVDDDVWAAAAERCSWSAMADAASTRTDTNRITLERADLPDDIVDYLRERADGVGRRFGYPLEG